MTAVQERILLNLHMNPYLDWGSHRDMINIMVPAEHFLDMEESGQKNFNPGFVAVMAIVEKDFLFEIMAKDGIENQRNHLKNEYSSDDAV